MIFRVYYTSRPVSERRKNLYTIVSKRRIVYIYDTVWVGPVWVNFRRLQTGGLESARFKSEVDRQGESEKCTENARGRTQARADGDRLGRSRPNLTGYARIAVGLYPTGRFGAFRIPKRPLGATQTQRGRN